jgi:hypothetical protein
MNTGGPVPPVEVDWAVRSKQPGRPMSYALLAGSGDRARAAELIESGVTGTPDGKHHNTVDELPWVSFVADAAEAVAEPRLAVVVYAWSEHRDGTGRPIVPARLAAVRWSAAGGTRPGFQSLWWVYRQLAFSTVDGPPAEVPDNVPALMPVPSMDVDRVAAAICDAEFNWALAVAVALLDGERVVILPPPDWHPSLVQRVDTLDAICALLPYGCRAWISAATWARDRSAHDVRLSFARSAREGQWATTYLGEAPPVQPRHPAAVSYHREMLAVYAEKTVAEIVHHLASASRPIPEDQPDLAVQHLQELRLEEAEYEEIQAGRGDPVRVHRVLVLRGSWAGMLDERRGAFLLFLVRVATSAVSAAAQALGTLRQFWVSLVAADFADVIVRELTEGDLRRAPSVLGAAYAAQPSWRGDVVALVLQQIGGKIDLPLARRTVNFLVALDSLDLTDSRACCAVAGSYPLGVCLLRRLPGEEERGQVLAALAPYTGVEGSWWLGPVRALFVEHRVDLGGVPPKIPRSLLRLLFDLAVQRRQLWPFLTVAGRHVLHHAFGVRDESGGFRHLAQYAEPVVTSRAEYVDGNAMTAAVADLLELGYRGTLSRQCVERPDYLPALAARWHELPVGAQTSLALRVPAAVLGTAVTSPLLTASSFAGLMNLCEALDPDRLRPPAVLDVCRRLAADTTPLPTLVFDARWAEDVERFAPNYVWLLQYIRLCEQGRDRTATAAHIAATYRRFRELRTPVQATLEAIAPWLGLQPIRLYDLIDNLREPDPYAGEIHQAVVIEGLFGAALADAYRQHADRVWQGAELQHQLNHRGAGDDRSRLAQLKDQVRDRLMG